MKFTLRPVTDLSDASEAGLAEVICLVCSVVMIFTLQLCLAFVVDIACIQTHRWADIVPKAVLLLVGGLLITTISVEETFDNDCTFYLRKLKFT